MIVTDSQTKFCANQFIIVIASDLFGQFTGEKTDPKTIGKIYLRLRNVCSIIVNKNSIKIGGHGEIVEIDVLNTNRTELYNGLESIKHEINFLEDNNFDQMNLNPQVKKRKLADDSKKEESNSETITKVVSEATESKQIVDQSEKKSSEVDAKAKTSSKCDPQVPQPVNTNQNNTDINQTAENINGKGMVNERNESKENKQTYSSILIHKPKNLKNRVPINACSAISDIKNLSARSRPFSYYIGQWIPKVDPQKVYQLISAFANIIRLEELSPNIPNRYFRSFKLTVESHFDYGIREATRENESVNHKACIADSGDAEKDIDIVEVDGKNGKDQVNDLNQSLVVNEDVLDEEDEDENQH
ncbi:unnamed protein product [Brachionus calyciflorus]|uniref:Uncharacterized protein n=1 Tax=Brachionus calyciflorus TaxID=104777 RepID=A0A814B0P6_9BILA|nr:unnamed protein product [Brachionus calyciflorus]